jgi:transposase
VPVDDRAALRGIVYVLCKSVSWRDVPAEQVGCSGVTAWRRLRDWTEAGVWPQLHEVLPAELRAAGLLDMDDAATDGSHVRALKGGLTPDLRRSTGPARQQTPPDRRPARHPARHLFDQRKPP